MGASLAAGDWDGDGHDDLAAGAPGENIGSTQDAGAATIFFGQPSTSDGQKKFKTQSEHWSQGFPGEFADGQLVGGDEREEAGDRAGASITIGSFYGVRSDTNHLIEDLAIGAPGEDILGPLVPLFPDQGPSEDDMPTPELPTDDIIDWRESLDNDFLIAPDDIVVRIAANVGAVSIHGAHLWTRSASGISTHTPCCGFKKN